MSQKGNQNSNSLDLDDFLKVINAKTSQNSQPIQTAVLPVKKVPPVSTKELYSKSIFPSELPKQVLKEKPVTNGISTKVIDVEEYKSQSGKPKFRINEGCIFCGFIHNRSEKNKIIYEDEFCAAFHDKAHINAQMHILMCPKDHIKNVYYVGKDNVSILTKLLEAGEALLKRLRPNESYRFGYHEPPMNTIDHLHLHCIVLPITSDYLNNVIYGFKLTPTDKIIAKVESGEIHPGNCPIKVKKTKK